jgi:hypothetical protein
LIEVECLVVFAQGIVEDELFDAMTTLCASSPISINNDAAAAVLVAASGGGSILLDNGKGTAPSGGLMQHFNTTAVLSAECCQMPK